VTFARVQYSAGTVKQRGADIDLNDVAYIRFARRSSTDCAGARPLSSRTREARPLSSRTREARPLSSRTREARPLSSRTREARVGIYSPARGASHRNRKLDPDTPSLRSVVRDDRP
jgi:hypothetical protein